MGAIRRCIAAVASVAVVLIAAGAAGQVSIDADTVKMDDAAGVALQGGSLQDHVTAGTLQPLLVNGIDQDGLGNEETLRFIDGLTAMVGPSPNPLRRVYFSNNAGGDLPLGVDNAWCTISAPCLSWAKLEEFAENDDEALWVVMDAGDTWTATAPNGDWHIVPNAPRDDWIWRRFSSTTTANECAKYTGGVCVGGSSQILCSAWSPAGATVMHTVGTGLGAVVWEDVDINCDAALGSLTSGGTAADTTELYVIGTQLINANTTEDTFSSDGGGSLSVCLNCDIQGHQAVVHSSEGSALIMIGGKVTMLGTTGSNAAFTPGAGDSGIQASKNVIVDVDIEQTGVTSSATHYISCDTNWGGLGKWRGLKLYMLTPTTTASDVNPLKCNPHLLGSQTDVLVDIELTQTTVQGFVRGIQMVMASGATDNSVYRLAVDGIMVDDMTGGFILRLEDAWCDLAGATGATASLTFAHFDFSSTQPSAQEWRIDGFNETTVAGMQTRMATCSGNAGVTMTFDDATDNDHLSQDCVSAEPEGVVTREPADSCNTLVMPEYTRDLFGLSIPAWILGRELKGFTFGANGSSSYGARE